MSPHERRSRPPPARSALPPPAPPPLGWRPPGRRHVGSCGHPPRLSRPRLPRFIVTRALGPRNPASLLDRRWDDLTRVSIRRNGVRVHHAGPSVALAATGADSAPWTRHTWGVERQKAFGREAIIVAAPRTEEYLTVERRVGPKVWSWRLEARQSKPLVELDGSISFVPAGRRRRRHSHLAAGRLPVGAQRTPSGSHWALERRGSGTYLTLQLDDRALPTPYVIDPIAIVGAPGQTGNTKTGSPLTISKPTGLATGNLLVATVSLRDATAALTPPAGWTLLTSIATSGATTKQFVYTKVATAGEPASYTRSWARGSGATDSTGVILAYSTASNVSVIVVDADLYGVTLVRDLHTVFPTTAVLAISKSPAKLARLARLARLGATAVPWSTPAAQIAALIRRLVKR